MNIKQLLNELKIKCKSDITIKNINELYMSASAGSIKDIIKMLLSEYKLKFAAEFCKQKDKNFIISIIMSNRRAGYLVVVSYPVIEGIVSLNEIIYPSYIFEREISDLYGLRILNGTDPRNIVKHECWEKEVYPLRKDFEYGRKIRIQNETPDYEFNGISGSDAYQIPVGPVHAGIIEPGHFRFTVMGEPIDNLEIRLMYKHRGIEKIAENMDANDLNMLFERVAGESTAAYAEAYAQLIEKLLNYAPAIEIKALRTALLELERIYNFIDDIAGICVDVAYSYPAKKLSYFSEIVHQLCERLSGSRYLRNAIVPLGSGISFDVHNKEDILTTLNSIKKRFFKLVDITLDEVSFLDRVEHTGTVELEQAKKLYMTGVVGRACGIDYDVRTGFGYELYPDIKNQNSIETVGGVFERYKLKVAEIRDAFDFIQAALLKINADIKAERTIIELREGLEAIACVETVKGELIVYGETNKNNSFNRIYFKTPSFTNWEGLTLAVLGEIVPDFPLCNKSFNMSYSENDR